ncbi:MAG TPA: hypothetical protein GXX29_03835 [Firmicutes bacterium]|nr:hypothetical protein [Bacillota bacterium]
MVFDLVWLSVQLGLARYLIPDDRPAAWPNIGRRLSFLFLIAHFMIAPDHYSGLDLGT